MREVKLTREHTAQVREVDDIERGDVRQVYRLADRDGGSTLNGQLGMDQIGALQDAVVVTFVESWTLVDGDGKPTPLDIKSVKKLRLRDYTALISALADVLAEIMSGQKQDTPDPIPAGALSTPAAMD